MVFTQRHLYITAHWDWPAQPDEGGQFGFRVLESNLPLEAAMDQVGTVFQTFWASVAANISSQYRLIEVKFALVEPNGLYPDGHSPYVWNPTTPVPGADTGASQYPAQISSVASLLTDVARGRGSRGRVYVPPIEQNIQSGGYWGTSDLNQRATAMQTLINGINAALAGDVAVMSSLGTGVSRKVTAVAIGNRPDVQRRRANQVTESYTTLPIT